MLIHCQFHDGSLSKFLFKFHICIYDSDLFTNCSHWLLITRNIEHFTIQLNVSPFKFEKTLPLLLVLILGICDRRILLYAHTCVYTVHIFVDTLYIHAEIHAIVLNSIWCNIHRFRNIFAYFLTCRWYYGGNNVQWILLYFLYEKES